MSDEDKKLSRSARFGSIDASLCIALTYDEIPLCLKPFSWEDFAAMHKMLLNGMQNLPQEKNQEIYQRFPLALDAFHNDGDEIHFAPSTFPPVLKSESDMSWIE